MVLKKLKLFLLVIALPAVLLSLASQISPPEGVTVKNMDCDCTCCEKEKCDGNDACRKCEERGHCEGKKTHSVQQ